MAHTISNYKLYLKTMCHEFDRAALEFYGIDHFRPSYDALVFFNNSKVTEENVEEYKSDPSYAGTFSVFGHVTCYGSEGHCEIHKSARRFDDRPSHPLTRAFKRITVTKALRKAIKRGDELAVRIVVNTWDEENQETDKPLLVFEGLQLVTFDDLRKL